MVRSLLVILFFVFLGQSYIVYKKSQPGYISTGLDAGEFLISHPGESRVVKLRLFQDAFISENCFRKKDINCKALQARMEISPEDLQGLPRMEVATRVCKERGGVSLTAKSYKDFDLHLCQFDDESLIGAMDLLL